ncbi:MAG: hypothetical protein CME62_07440 [Halobacteriovoraceae bacterium]|nr:hypothetical protein [Halobacteriovoraceae bacterium]|tara:strand:+ start:23838 stop:25118 length:1281 start_codon:yes stop_codon:yes gene_type:complete
MKKQLLTLLTTTTLTLSSAFSATDEAVRTNNFLGEKLATSIIKTTDKTENFMISGTSLQQALSIVANGSAGWTRTTLEDYLDTSIEHLNESNLVMRNAINFTEQQRVDLTTRSLYLNPAVITTNNSIWRTTYFPNGGQYSFSPEFIDTAKTFYHAEHQVLNFNDEASVATVNKWAEDNTNGLVKKIIKHSEMKDMLWMVMNATYMEASWSERFYELTRSAPVFTLANGERTVPKMMASTQFVNYMELEDESEMVAMKLNSDQEGTDLAFVAYLPKQGKELKKSQLDFFQSEIKKLTLPALVSRSESLNAKVIMPKFSFDYSVSMQAYEKLTLEMGLNDLFLDRADFSQMATHGSLPSKVGLIKQNTKIELDEKGIKAAAVTVIGGVRATSVGPGVQKNIILDRPFMFAIVDRNTQAVLFSGSVVNP